VRGDHSTQSDGLPSYSHAHSDTDAGQYFDPDPNIYTFLNRYPNWHGHWHGHGDTDADRNSDADSDPEQHADTDADRNSNPDSDPEQHADTDADGNSNADPDPEQHADTDADGNSDPDSDPNPNIHTFLKSPMVLAVWFMDDGGRRNDSYGLFLNTLSFTKAENELLRLCLQENHTLDSRLHWVQDGYRIYIPSRDAKRFCEIVSPYLIPSLKYKLSYNPVTTSFARLNRARDRRSFMCL